MNYRRKNKRNHKRTMLISLGVVLVIIVTAIFSKSVSSVLFKTASGIAYPFWKTKLYVGEKVFVVGALFKSRESLVQENSDLKEELLKRKARVFDLDLLEEENKNLRAIVGRSDATSTLPAFILARPPLTPYDVFVVDRGGSAGVATGNKVFFENILLGEVVEVSAQTSKIRLLSSGGIETEALLSSQNLPIKMAGRGGGNLIGSVSQEVKVLIGEAIIIPGEKNKILGKVEEIEKSPTSAFKKIYARLPVNLSELRWVSIEQ